MLPQAFLSPRPPRLIAGQAPRLRTAAESLPACTPPIWARGAHAQTMLGHFLPSPSPEEAGERVEIPLPDGDRLVAFVFKPSAAPATSGHESAVAHARPTIFFFHGLGGTSDADYMQRGARLALELGATAVLVNHRGAGAGQGFARGIYHSGRGDDVGEALRWGRARFPGQRQLAIGYSLSGNALLSLLTGIRGDARNVPDAAITVNAPIELAHASRLLGQGISLAYDTRFVRLLLADLRARERLNLLPPGLPQPHRVPAWWRIRLARLDQLLTAPAGGFADAQDYYARCSTQAHLSRIRVPTVLLTSHDDPIVPSRGYREATLAEGCLLHIEPHGGHMGYIARGTSGPHWLEKALGAYIRALAAPSA